jgi:hypothetical protein
VIVIISLAGGVVEVVKDAVLRVIAMEVVETVDVE